MLIPVSMRFNNYNLVIILLHFNYMWFFCSQLNINVLLEKKSFKRQIVWKILDVLLDFSNYTFSMPSYVKYTNSLYDKVIKIILILQVVKKCI